MPDRYWVGVDQNWHDTNNWSLTSGGTGGAGIPTADDDVYFDANGNNFIWFAPAFVCKNLTFESTASSKFFIFDQGGIIHGDFLQGAGYFAPTGGGGHTLEFKGNWESTGGTFSVGTGTGIDPTCLFSGIGKTYQLNQTSSANFQNFSVSGTYDFSGTRLTVANISQKISVTGTMNILTGSRIDLSGNNAGFDVFTGEITGAGRFWYRYGENNTMPTTGTITIRYWRFILQDSIAVLNPRTYSFPCEVEIDYNDDGQIFRLEGTARHYFYKLTILCDEAGVDTAEFDCDTNTAEMWFNGTFDNSKDYCIRADGGSSLTDADRYVVGTSESSGEMAYIKQKESGRWKIENNQLTYYDTDGVAVLKRFNLFDADGEPTNTNPFERVPI